MPSLNSYINFNVYLDKSQEIPHLRFVDIGAYPTEILPALLGYFEVTQPDGITVVQGTNLMPSVSWFDGALTQPTIELRLNTAQNFQNGTYTIKYTNWALGYTGGLLTKTFHLEYAPSVPVLSKAFDLFTPSLVVKDATSYGQTGFRLDGIIRQWNAMIKNVAGTNRTITGSAIDFDLSYNGNYYDSIYDVRAFIYPQYVLNSPYGWVGIMDKLLITKTFTAEIPPTLEQLLAKLTDLKTSIDTCIGGKKCSCDNCEKDKVTYALATSIYIHMVHRGRKGDLSGLSLYIQQLQKIFNDHQTPGYTNTNSIIPEYDWGILEDGGSSDWDDISDKPITRSYKWIVGEGGYPDAGATLFTNSNFTNVPAARILVYRNGLPQFDSNKGDGDSYFTKTTADNFIGFAPALTTEEKIMVTILPL